MSALLSEMKKRKAETVTSVNTTKDENDDIVEICRNGEKATVPSAENLDVRVIKTMLEFRVVSLTISKKGYRALQRDDGGVVFTITMTDTHNKAIILTGLCRSSSDWSIAKKEITLAIVNKPGFITFDEGCSHVPPFYEKGFFESLCEQSGLEEKCKHVLEDNITMITKSWLRQAMKIAQKSSKDDGVKHGYSPEHNPALCLQSALTRIGGRWLRFDN